MPISMPVASMGRAAVGVLFGALFLGAVPATTATHDTTDTFWFSKGTESSAECDLPAFIGATKCIGVLASMAGGNIHGSIAILGPDAKFDMTFEVAVAATGAVAVGFIDDTPTFGILSYVDGESLVTIQPKNGEARQNIDRCFERVPASHAKVCTSVQANATSNNDECISVLSAKATASNAIGQALYDQILNPNPACPRTPGTGDGPADLLTEFLNYVSPIYSPDDEGESVVVSDLPPSLQASFRDEVERRLVAWADEEMAKWPDEAGTRVLKAALLADIRSAAQGIQGTVTLRTSR